MRGGKELRKSEKISVAAFVKRSRVNGPGLRSVLWVQGCPFRCDGCFNQQFQELRNDNLYDTAEVIQWVLEVRDTQGVTFSGGEPFAQAAGLAEVAGAVRKAGKTVVIFSGYTKFELFAGKDYSRQKLLENSDLLIAGPYEKEKPCNHPLLSSSGQELVFITDKYRDYDFGGNQKKVEIKIRPDGTIQTTGFPSEDLLVSRFTRPTELRR